MSYEKYSTDMWENICLEWEAPAWIFSLFLICCVTLEEVPETPVSIYKNDEFRQLNDSDYTSECF